jgi:GAF domain-containing protein
LTIRNIQQLIERVTRLITERFGFYHVGIFILDERNEYAVLQGSSSPGGKRMLERGHRLKVGEVGIVGSVAASKTARISLDVGEDAVYFDNPDLPDTRSEMALPLLAGGTILGVLDVQSIEPNAFAEDDIGTLQILADQIAVSIQNALFLEQTQEALEATRRAYEERSRQGWQQYFGLEREIGYLSAGDKTVEVSQELDPDIARTLASGKVEVGSDGKTIGIPVQSRNQIIGAIRLQKPTTTGDWSESEILDAQNLANQLSLALESARLYDESRQRAEREAAIADITSKIGADPSMEAILQTTIRELGQTLGDAQVLIQLKSGSVITE